MSSPAWHADELGIPLRVHATGNDGDVNELEIDRLVEAFAAIPAFPFRRT